MKAIIAVAIAGAAAIMLAVLLDAPKSPQALARMPAAERASYLAGLKTFALVSYRCRADALTADALADVDLSLVRDHGVETLSCAGQEDTELSPAPPDPISGEHEGAR